MIFSLVVPIYNDAYLADEFCADFEQVFQRYLGKPSIEEDVELIFVNDGSRDDSFATLRDVVCEKFKFAKAVDLSRNFGQHVAASAGYRFARGDYVGYVNVDREDPPSELVRLLDAVRAGEYDFAGGCYQTRDVTLLNRITSKSFMWVLNKLTGYSVPLNMAAARVMNRRFIDAYNGLTEKSRYLPGLESWLGFRRTWIPIEHRPRTRGKSSYNFGRRLALALDAIVSFSDLPLKLAVVLGGLVAFLGFAMSLFLVIQRLLFAGIQPGFTSTTCVIVIMGGVQILVLGLASIYIGRILREVQGRPLFVVRATKNFPPDAKSA